MMADSGDALALTAPDLTDRRQPRSVLSHALIGAFRTYQAGRAGRMSPCRFTPTCSAYAIEAVDRHGARRGMSLTFHRLLRCRPGGTCGFDPVPE